MASRFEAKNAVKNAKRRDRRVKLADRLHLAEKDADRIQKRFEPSGRASTSSPRGKPSHAAHLREHLVEPKEELLSPGDERDHVQGDLDANDYMQGREQR